MRGELVAAAIRRAIDGGKVRRLEDGPVGGTPILLGDENCGHLLDCPLPDDGAVAAGGHCRHVAGADSVPAAAWRVDGHRLSRRGTSPHPDRGNRALRRSWPAPLGHLLGLGRWNAARPVRPAEADGESRSHLPDALGARFETGAEPRRRTGFRGADQVRRSRAATGHQREGRPRLGHRDARPLQPRRPVQRQLAHRRDDGAARHRRPCLALGDPRRPGARVRLRAVVQLDAPACCCTGGPPTRRRPDEAGRP